MSEKKQSTQTVTSVRTTSAPVSSARYEKANAVSSKSETTTAAHLPERMTISSSKTAGTIKVRIVHQPSRAPGEADTMS